MKRIIPVVFISLILVLLVIIKVVSCQKKKEKEQVSVSGQPLLVDAVVIHDTSMNYHISTIGVLRANEEVSIVSEIQKKVTGIYMKEGASVERGDLLFKLDDADLLARMKKLKVKRKFAMINELREKALFEKGGISKETYDLATNQVETLDAELEILKVELSKTEILAPFGGRIGIRYVSEGCLVTPDMILTNLDDIRKIKLDFSIPERYADDIKPGQEVRFNVENDAEEFKATITACEPAIDLSTRTLWVRAVTKNTEGFLVPGSSAKIEIDLQRIRESIFIPSSALIPSAKGYSVFIIRNSMALNLPVETGIRTQTHVQILTGLQAGDTLITTNLLRIRNELPVKLGKLNHP
ncbi:MAG: efflux RND transporter periplasmic adaptor subunit [Bacteroidia bacterium]|nr:efflux RND transporter periplasmic adaptor subunit [Bacteroidia bacterium]